MRDSRGIQNPAQALFRTMPLAQAVVPISCYNGLRSEKHPSFNELVGFLLVEEFWGGARWNFFLPFLTPADSSLP